MVSERIDFCPACGATAVRTVHGDFKVNFRDNPVTLENQDYPECQACGEQPLTPDQHDAFRLMAATVVRRERGLLTPDEIRSGRTRLEMSQSALEAVLGAGPKTVTRWEKGTVFQNSTADKLMRLVFASDLATIELLLGGWDSARISVEEYAGSSARIKSRVMNRSSCVDDDWRPTGMDGLEARVTSDIRLAA